MEKLKSAIPDYLINMVGISGPHDLPHTCSALLNYLHPLEHFHQIVKQLSDPDATTCAKDQVAASEWKAQGNTAFAKQDYPQALKYYTLALQCMPLSMDKIDKTMVATLHFNRASALRKMGMLKESIRDCSRAIKLHPSHSKAWYCKGQANAGLKNYEEAINNMHMSLASEDSSLGKKQVRFELESIMQQSKRAKEVEHFWQTHDQDDFDIENELKSNHSGLQEAAEVHIVSTADRGREIQAKNTVLPGDLMLHEEPYVAVILKQCRDTHCHFCFKELPGDPMPCEFCAIPLYCSENCRENAGGSLSGSENMSLPEQILDGSHHEIAISSLFKNDFCKISQMDVEDGDWYEHKHECGGMSWAAVLPTEVVLSARMLMKSLNNKSFGYFENHSSTMNLCHHYEKMHPQDKLELHIFSIVLTCCLQSSSSGLLQLTGTTISEIVLLIARVKVNAMAIVHMSSPETTSKQGISIENNMTCSIEQVKVAQAIYLRGSAFNHSCDPNIHASFVSRSLLVHAIKYLPSGSPLELCYGPQVGESGIEDRQRWLKQRYFFVCKCNGCSELNFSDLVQSSFRCTKHSCQGVVLDKAVTRLEVVVGTDRVAYAKIGTWDLKLPADEEKQQSIVAVALLLIAPENESMKQIGRGHCLCCGCFFDLGRKQELANQSWECLERVHEETNLHDYKERLLDDAFQSLQSLKSTLHCFNKQIARAEDIVAKMCCLSLQPQSALHHCKESIQILEKLFHGNHIVVGNELVKFVSIALALNEYECAQKNLARIDNIFSTHYGFNYAKIFPYLRYMQKLDRDICGKI